MKQIFLIAASVALIGCSNKPRATDQKPYAINGGLDTDRPSYGSFTGGQLVPSGHDQPKHELAGILGPQGDRSLTVCVGVPCTEKPACKNADTIDAGDARWYVCDHGVWKPRSLEAVPVVTCSGQCINTSLLPPEDRAAARESVINQMDIHAISGELVPSGQFLGVPAVTTGTSTFPGNTGVTPITTGTVTHQGNYTETPEYHGEQERKHSYACGKADGMIATATTLERLDIAQSVMDIIAGFGCDPDRELIK